MSLGEENQTLKSFLALVYYELLWWLIVSHNDSHCQYTLSLDTILVFKKNFFFSYLVEEGENLTQISPYFYMGIGKGTNSYQVPLYCVRPKPSLYSMGFNPFFSLSQPNVRKELSMYTSFLSCSFTTGS